MNTFCIYSDLIMYGLLLCIVPVAIIMENKAAKKHWEECEKYRYKPNQK